MHTVPAVKTFQYKLHDVRLIDQDGNPWFVRADARRALGLNINNRYSSHLLESEKGISLVQTPGGPQRMAIVSESGLYKLILRSDKAEAQAFQNWVTREVLPAIRKTGHYDLASSATLDHQTIDRQELALRYLSVNVQIDELFGIPKILALTEAVKLVSRQM